VNHGFLDELVGHLLRLAEQEHRLRVDVAVDRLLRTQLLDLLAQALVLRTHLVALEVAGLHLVGEQVEELAHLGLVETAHPV
jgi:hypothetical protein